MGNRVLMTLWIYWKGLKKMSENKHFLTKYKIVLLLLIYHVNDYYAYVGILL